MRLKLRRIFRRFVRQAPYLTYLSFYCIVGIITIWFSQNTTYNFFIRQEMWWGRSLITGRCGKLWRETMWRNTSFCRAALIITRSTPSKRAETSPCLPWRSCARSLAVLRTILYLSNSGCWRLNWWPLFLYKKRTRQTAIQLSARLKLSCCPNQCLCFQQKRCQYTVIFSLYPPLGH